MDYIFSRCRLLLLAVLVGAMEAATGEAGAALGEAGAALGEAGAAHPCHRPCEAGRTMTCRYEFHVENYHSMSKACFGCPWNATDCARPHCIAADGVPRALVVVNRQLPGPSLQVCQGDRVEVTVHNHMPEQSTSIHWHGMHMRGTPYMDGVPFVTQCPVQSHSRFRYSFHADNPGTHFWHSHTGCQRADGALGLLTVRVPPEVDPHASLYDEDLPEHGILVWDWTHQPAASKFLAHHHAGDDNKADSVLINGKGAFRRFVLPGGAAEDGQRRATFTPREEFHVKQGSRYRFRLVNAGFLNCPLELSIDNHTLLVIASDGSDVKPVRVDSLVSYAGERWDVVVEANQAVANYWVRLHGLLDCGPRRAHEAAVLRYEGADPSGQPGGPAPSYDVRKHAAVGLQVNPLNRGSSDQDTISAAELQAVPPAAPTLWSDPALRPQADVQLFVSYDFYAVDNPHIHRAGLYGVTQVANSPHRVFTPQLNHISLSLPAFPLLPGRDRVRPDSLCNETSLLAEGRDCDREYCECTHVVRVPLGGVLEIILVDQGVRYDANHPFHLHGHSFRVVALERLGTSTTVEEVRRLDREGLLPRNLEDPPTKDTVTVPDGGYTVLRVHANNPGYWLFHCHIEFHVELGMALVVKVGEHEDMPPVPRGFPQCGDWGSHGWPGEDEADEDHRDLAEKSEDLEPSNHISRSLDTLSKKPVGSVDEQQALRVPSSTAPRSSSTTSRPPSPLPPSSTPPSSLPPSSTPPSSSTPSSSAPSSSTERSSTSRSVLSSSTSSAPPSSPSAPDSSPTSSSPSISTEELMSTVPVTEDPNLPEMTKSLTLFPDGEDMVTDEQPQDSTEDPSLSSSSRADEMVRAKYHYSVGLQGPERPATAPPPPPPRLALSEIIMRVKPSRLAGGRMLKRDQVEYNVVTEPSPQARPQVGAANMVPSAASQRSVGALLLTALLAVSLS